MEHNKKANYLFELGEAYNSSGSLLEASKALEQASTLYFNQKKYAEYIDTLLCLFDIYKELKKDNKIQQMKEELTALSWERNKHLTPLIHYTIGQCYLHEEQMDKAQDEFTLSLNKAENLCIQSEKAPQKITHQLETIYATFGLSLLDSKANKLLESDRKIESIRHQIQKIKEYSSKRADHHLEENNSTDDFLKKNSHSIEKLSIAVEFLYVDNLFLKQSYKESKTHLWEHYESVQKSKNLQTIIHFFYYLGKNYIYLRDYKQAYTFLNLAKKSIDKNNFKRLHCLITSHLEQLKSIQGSDYDLIVNLENNSIVERHKGKIPFKSQYILMELFKIFLDHPGTVYSKEKIAEELWREKYDPHVHNNKIYVTIKRLRELMEPNCQSPTYIFRNKDGYYFNKNAKILLEDKDQSSDKNPEVSL